MENFKHLPEPFRIRVIEPVKRTTRAYREEAIVRAGMNPFLLDSEDVFIVTVHREDVDNNSSGSG